MGELRARIVTSTADRSAACDLVRLAFAVERPALAERARVLASPRRARADWWVLEDDGRPVSALLRYPLQFGLPSGEVAAGFGLGAVSTPPDLRRRGHATDLCRRVAEHEAARGRDVGLLFSAIAPGFYERLGYRTCPAWAHDCARPGELARSGPRAELAALDPWSAVPRLDELYRRAHEGILHLHRDEAAWERTLLEHPQSWWLGLGDPQSPRGLARVEPTSDTLYVLEVALEDRTDESPLLRALAALAEELGLKRLRGWLTPSPLVDEWFVDEGRATTLPMVVGTRATDGARFWGTDYF